MFVCVCVCVCVYQLLVHCCRHLQQLCGAAATELQQICNSCGAAATDLQQPATELCNSCGAAATELQQSCNSSVVQLQRYTCIPCCCIYTLLWMFEPDVCVFVCVCVCVCVCVEDNIGRHAASEQRVRRDLKVLNLLALLVQKYKYCRSSGSAGSSRYSIYLLY